jgi:endonuclease G
MNPKQLRHLLPLLALTIVFAACDKNDDGNSSGYVNENHNTQGPFTQRLEIPHLKGGTDNLFISHSTDAYGINYCLEWDCTKKSQRWTAYEMYASNSVTNWNRNNWSNTDWDGDPFQEDTSIPAAYRTTLSDYRYTGYNRGHICPSADRLCSQDANEQTFYLSNMQPQLYAFNAGIWENMENQVRTWNKNTFRDTLYVCKGGTIDRTDQTLGYTNNGKLLIPRYFFMAILCKNAQGYKAIAFWVEHKTSQTTSQLSAFAISIDELEQKTGIDFFCNLPDDVEKQVEANVYINSWGLK